MIVYYAFSFEKIHVTQANVLPHEMHQTLNLHLLLHTGHIPPSLDNVRSFRLPSMSPFTEIVLLLFLAVVVLEPCLIWAGFALGCSRG